MRGPDAIHSGVEYNETSAGHSVHAGLRAARSAAGVDGPPRAVVNIAAVDVLTYENFDLVLERGPAGYRSHLVRSPAGELSEDFGEPLRPDELVGPIGPGAGPRRDFGVQGSASSRLDQRALGTLLYRAAFPSRIDKALGRSLAGLGDDRGLRVRLMFGEEVSELAALPWECLYVPEPGRFLALSPRTPVIRFLRLSVVERPAGPLSVAPPLTVLVAAADPSDVTALNVEKEWNRLCDALAPLRERGLVRLERLPTTTLKALGDRLDAPGPVHVFHFIGHGHVRAGSGGGVAFERADGSKDLVFEPRLGAILHEHRSLRLVFLNACDSAAGGRGDAFVGVAQNLIGQGVPAAIAMQSPITDAAAITLSEQFYRSLAAGASVEAALTRARLELLTADDSPEWATPVLISRSDDNRLLEPSQSDAKRPLERLPFEPPTVLIPAGPFVMGRDPEPDIAEEETPAGSVELPDYRIGVSPVTHREYAAYLAANPERPAPDGWSGRLPPKDREEHPVGAVSWYDATAYCRWLSHVTGRRYHLPSEAEWEKAASWVRGTADAGPQKRRYPWGDAWLAERCNADGEATTAVTAHPDGASACGCLDMLGNVEEWTRSRWGYDPRRPQFRYPYRQDDEREVIGEGDSPAHLQWMVHRGGSFRSQPSELSCTARGSALPHATIDWRGFRVAVAIPPTTHNRTGD